MSHFFVFTTSRVSRNSFMSLPSLCKKVGVTFKEPRKKHAIAMESGEKWRKVRVGCIAMLKTISD